MKKPVDYENLRNVIEAGVKQACKDAGLERFAIEIGMYALVVVSNKGPEQIPCLAIDVTELTEEQQAEIDRARVKREGN